MQIREFTAYLHEVYDDTQVTGVEIGVLWGTNAKSMIETLNIGKLYLVDPYLVYKEYCDGNTPKPCMDRYRASAYKLLAPFKDEIQWLWMKSDDAWKEIHESLDFAYIDGNHREGYVYRDCVNFWQLLKPGGILGGDDYCEPFKNMEVKPAVDRFAAERGLSVTVRKGDAYKFADWWITKPCGGT